MCFIRKFMDRLFTQKELKYLDDIMPESHKRAKADDESDEEVSLQTKHGAMGRPIDQSWPGPIELFLIPASAPGLCYPVCGMVHITEPLLLIEKSIPCGSSGFPFSLSEWSFTICPMPYNCK